VLFLLTLLLPVAGRLVRLSGRVTLLSVVLLTLIQLTSAVLGRRSPVPAALHPANALLMVALTVLLLMQGWHLMWQRSDEMKTSGGPPS